MRIRIIVQSTIDTGPVQMGQREEGAGRCCRGLCFSAGVSWKVHAEEEYKQLRVHTFFFLINRLSSAGRAGGGGGGGLMGLPGGAGALMPFAEGSGGAAVGSLLGNGGALMLLGTAGGGGMVGGWPGGGAGLELLDDPDALLALPCLGGSADATALDDASAAGFFFFFFSFSEAFESVSIVSEGRFFFTNFSFFTTDESDMMTSPSRSRDLPALPKEGVPIDEDVSLLMFDDFSFLTLSAGGNVTSPSIGPGANVFFSSYCLVSFRPRSQRTTTYVDEEASISRVTDNDLPAGITTLQRCRVTDDEQGAFGSGQGDVHTPRILQETDRLQSRAGTDGRQDDDVLFLTLETVDRVEAVPKVSDCSTRL